MKQRDRKRQHHRATMALARELFPSMSGMSKGRPAKSIPLMAHESLFMLASNNRAASAVAQFRKIKEQQK